MHLVKLIGLLFSYVVSSHSLFIVADITVTSFYLQ